MSYSKDTLLKATQVLESRRSKAQRIQLARHMEVTEKFQKSLNMKLSFLQAGLPLSKHSAWAKMLRNISMSFRE